MKKTIHLVAAVSMSGAVNLMVDNSAWGLGFRNPDQDGRATGQGQAFTAQADDASAIYYNPAGLTQLKGTEIVNGAYIMFPNVHFHPNGGGDFHPDHQMNLIPHLYVASDFGLEKWRFGIGVTVPYGNNVDWGNTGPFQYLTTRSQLSVINTQPTVAYQFNEHFSMGAGLNIYYANTSIERNLPPSFGGGHFRFHGYGEAFGGTAGLLWKINPQHSIGMVYRSPFAVTFEGSGSVKGSVLAAANGSSSAGASLQFPQTMAIGYAYRPVPKLKLEADVDWTDWNTLNTVYLRSSNPLFNAGTNPSQATIPFNWEDSFLYEFGVQYELNTQWTVRGGYIYSMNTVPDSTFSPNVPDSNRHVMSVGVSYARKRMSLDLVYQYCISQDRTVSGSVNSPAVDGTWKSDSHAVMVSSSVKF